MARDHPDRAVVGLELSPLPFVVAWLVNRLNPLANLRFRRRDFMAEELADADVVVCFLYGGAMTRLSDKLARELRPGAVVVSNYFALPGWTAATRASAGDAWASPVYVYRVDRNTNHAPPPGEI